ncbi:hypothetical protein CHS0354_005557, partial [Potamilus streckersoni]
MTPTHWTTKRVCNNHLDLTNLTSGPFPTSSAGKQVKPIKQIDSTNVANISD